MKIAVTRKPTQLKNQNPQSFTVYLLSTISAVGLVAAILLSPGEQSKEEKGFEEVVRPVVNDSCIQCHGAKEKIKGDVNLMELKSLADLTKNPELIQKMIDVLDFEEMPPEDEEPLGTETPGNGHAPYGIVESSRDRTAGLFRDTHPSDEPFSV
jgi:hypothetical protein